MTRIVGFYETLVQGLRFEDESEYKKLVRMTPQDFNKNLGLIKEYITKTKKNMRDSIPAHKKLVATTQSLNRSDNCTNLQYQFRVQKFTTVLQN